MFLGLEAQLPRGNPNFLWLLQLVLIVGSVPWAVAHTWFPIYAFLPTTSKVFASVLVPRESYS